MNGAQLLLGLFAIRSPRVCHLHHLHHQQQRICGQLHASQQYNPHIYQLFSARFLSSTSSATANKDAPTPSTSQKPIKKKTLFLANVFPDVSASAAGVRTQSLLDGWTQYSKVHFATSMNHHHDHTPTDPLSSSSLSSTKQKAGGAVPVATPVGEIVERLKTRNNITWSYLPPNRSNHIKEFIMQQQQQQQEEEMTPWDMIVFDRFYVEEAYSFHFHEHAPNAAFILDMQDMHSLRKGREELVREFDKKQKECGAGTEEIDMDPLMVLNQVMEYIPSLQEDSANSNALATPLSSISKSSMSSSPSSSLSSASSMLLRELGSIQRSDLTLVCSPYEMHLLQKEYGISPNKLCLAPFFVPPNSIHRPKKQDSPSSSSSSSPPTFIFCGGFKHPPNVDAVRILLRYIWPLIRKQLPTARLHIHGAYCPAEFYQYNQNQGKDSQHKQKKKNTGIHVYGYTPSLEQVFGLQQQQQQGSRIVLAPLRFGAGIKGKIIDAWTFGLPVVTTPIGAEGMVPYANYHQRYQNTKSSNVIGHQKQLVDETFGGAVAWSVQEFVESAVSLATDPAKYNDAREKGQNLLRTLYDQGENWNRTLQAVKDTIHNLPERRAKDVTRALLWHHSSRSTEYFSRWIELKENLERNRKP